MTLSNKKKKESGDQEKVKFKKTQINELMQQYLKKKTQINELMQQYLKKKKHFNVYVADRAL